LNGYFEANNGFLLKFPRKIFVHIQPFANLVDNSVEKLKVSNRNCDGYFGDNPKLTKPNLVK